MAQAKYNQIQALLNQESQALKFLHSANSSLAACTREIKEALSYSQWGVHSSSPLQTVADLSLFRHVGRRHVRTDGLKNGSSSRPIRMSDMMERNALSNAEGHAMQTGMFVQQAKFTSPQVQPIGEISIAHGYVLLPFVLLHSRVRLAQSCPTSSLTTYSPIWRSMVRPSR